MQSKTSYFNGTLFRKNLSRYWPLWGFASFVGFLAPAALLIQVIQDRDWVMDRLLVREMYYQVIATPLPVVTIAYAILCAMAVWGYLYQPRSVGLMHTLPIRREGLFLTNLLSGLAMMLIPYAVAGGLGSILFVCCGGFDAWSTLVTIGAVAGESLLFFGIATFCAFLTGSIFALPALYFLLNFLAPLGHWILNLYAHGFLFGLANGYSSSSRADILSPVIYLLNRVRTNAEYRSDPSTSTSGLSSVTLVNGHLIAIYAAVGAVLLFLAFLLYRRRASERAGDVVAVPAFRPVFRFGVAALTALLGGRLLYALLWESFQPGTTFSAIPMGIFLVVAGLIGYYGASMLLKKSLQVFRGSAVGALCLVAACIAFCAGMRFDVFGMERYIPAESEIRQLELYVANNTYYFTPEDQPELLAQAQELQQAILDQKELIRQDYTLYELGSTSGEPTAYTTIHFTYTLKNGSTVDRWYNLDFSRARLEEDGSYAALLDRFVNSSDARQARLRWNDPNFRIDGGSFNSQRSGAYFGLGTQECEALLAAVARDAENGTWGNYDWFESDGSAYAMDLGFDFYRDQTDEAGRQYEEYDTISITIRPGMTETQQTLLDLNLATEEDFVTWDELNETDTSTSSDAEETSETSYNITGADPIQVPSDAEEASTVEG